MLRIVGMLGVALATLMSVGQASADTLDGAYRGTIVCEKMKNSQFMLQAPFDVTVSGKSVIAARPIFNLKGTRVVASEIATGTLADDGTVRLVSNWKGAGSSFQGNYGGALTDKGAALTGTQAWTTADGAQTRACTVAIIQAKS